MSQEGDRQVSEGQDEPLAGAPSSLAALFVCAILIVILLTAAFRTGIDRGMDRVIPSGVDRYNIAIAIALSDMVYDLGYGYVGHRKVLQVLQRNGMTKIPVLQKSRLLS